MLQLMMKNNDLKILKEQKISYMNSKSECIALEKLSSKLCSSLINKEVYVWGRWQDKYVSGEISSCKGYNHTLIKDFLELNESIKVIAARFDKNHYIILTVKNNLVEFDVALACVIESI